MYQNFSDSNEITRAYMDALLIEMRHLDSVEPDPSFTFCGRRFDTPVMIAAFSHLNPFHDDGMVEMARGAKLANALNWAGMGDEAEFDAIRATGAESIKIVKPYADEKLIHSRLERAQAAGALAVGMDIDHSYGHDGRYDNVLGWQMHAKTTEQLRSYVQSTDLPFIVKGVLSLTDAEKCVKAGVKGLLLSHHHGIIPYAVPPLMLLPELARAFGKEVDLFVDCGIADGSDVFKALALGAKAVCVGRAVLPAFKQKGAQGVAEYLAQMTDELRGIMARTATPDTAHVDPTVLHAGFGLRP